MLPKEKGCGAPVCFSVLAGSAPLGCTAASAHRIRFQRMRLEYKSLVLYICKSSGFKANLLMWEQQVCRRLVLGAVPSLQSVRRD